MIFQHILSGVPTTARDEENVVMVTATALEGIEELTAPSALTNVKMTARVMATAPLEASVSVQMTSKELIAPLLPPILLGTPLCVP